MGTRPTAGAGLSVSLLFKKLKIPTENGNANGKRNLTEHFMYYNKICMH